MGKDYLTHIIYQWLDDVSRWPNLEFGDLYTYLIDSIDKRKTEGF